ncbi:MAG: SOS response-associated peptidase [Micropruina sp.]|uniref:SOS response-associated peptidase n=1 Tax=Micropruina sp. TaxID=2737536 RepID=UPI0039E26342
MCGRYASSADASWLEEVFEIDEMPDEVPPPRYNIAPTDPVLAVVERTPKDAPARVVRKLVELRWGLVPSWSRDAKGGARMINARFETVAEKPAFRRALAVRRCLLPADGYYEWYAPEGSAELPASRRPPKQPFFIHPADGSRLAMAGLYEFWKSPAGEWLSTCTIITTTAADAVGHIHDRMPMTVRPEAWDAWLDPHRTEGALDLLDAPGAQLEAYAVSRLVSTVGNDGPELIEPLPES